MMAYLRLRNLFFRRGVRFTQTQNPQHATTQD
jgi:hypothetical protein